MSVTNDLSRASRLEVCDEILAILFLLQASKDHLGPLQYQKNKYENDSEMAAPASSKNVVVENVKPRQPLTACSSTNQPTNQQSTKQVPNATTYFDVLLRVLQVCKKRVLTPQDSTLFVGGGVRVAIGLSGLTTKEAVQIGSLLVRAALFDSVALRALGLENLGSLLFAHG